MSTLNFKDLAIKIIREQKKPMTAREIWETAIKKGYDKLGNFGCKAPWRAIIGAINLAVWNDTGSFVVINSKPKRYFLMGIVSDSELARIKKSEDGKIEESKGVGYSEKELHPFLTYFAYAQLNVNTKTIRHEKSKKKSYTKWLHPDIVGVYFPIEEWKEEVFDFSREIGFQSIKLYSFELKKVLDFSNLRESFFQAVSNSSWANEGYLVAAEIEQDDEFMDELKRLSSAFDIGIIKLEIEEPDASEIVLPAPTKNVLDWDTINKLAKENPDFAEFIKRIRTDLSSKEVRKEKYDKVFDSEKLIELMKK